MPMTDVCAAFGVGQSTASGKARVYRTRCTSTGWSSPGWRSGLLARGAVAGPGDRVHEGLDSLYIGGPG